LFPTGVCRRWEGGEFEDPLADLDTHPELMGSSSVAQGGTEQTVPSFAMMATRLRMASGRARFSLI
jgi:hypothetical protein